MITALALAAASSFAASVDPVAPALVSPLTRSAIAFSARADVNAVSSVVESSANAWSAMAGLDELTIAGLPLGATTTVDVALRKIDALAPGGSIVVMQSDKRGQPVAVPLATPAVDFYAGQVLGAPGSRVFLAHCASFTHGYAMLDGHTFIISSGAPGSAAPIVSYDLTTLPADAIIWKPFECETLTPSSVPVPNHEGGIAGGAPICRHLKLALDSDNELNAVYGGDVTATAAYMLLQAAAINEIYTSNLNVRVQASYVRIWTAPDPWTQTGSGSQLGEFRDYWQANMGGTTRDVAMLLSARGLGGGVAWLNSMCNQWAYNVSGNLAGWFPYPLQNNSDQNWDIMVTAHELGHNVGSPHTHDFCPPVDQCAPNGYFGGCQTEQVCTNQGTIMSYCHLCGGGLANVQLQFATASKDIIDESLAAASCNLTGIPQAPWAVADFASTVSVPISIDVLANDVLANCESVVIHTFTQPAAGQGSVTRLVGAGPGGRDLLQYTGPANLNAAVTFTYTLKDASNQIGLPGTVRVEKGTYWPATSVVGALNNVQVRYYVLSAPQVLPDFASLTPYLTTTTPTINYPSTGGNFANSGRSEEVGAAWTGWLNVPTNNLYTLYLNSDDGSKLWIDGTLIVNNDGLHGMVEKSAIVPLAAGRHALRVEFFENGGGAGCILSYSSSSIPKTTIGPAAFSYGGTAVIADFNFDGIVDGADLGALLGMWGTADLQCDLNDDGIVDGADLGILLGAWSS